MRPHSVDARKALHYCKVLGIRPPASGAQVKQAYWDLAQVWHPDRFSGNSRLQEKAEERLREINEAYESLRDGVGALAENPEPVAAPSYTPARKHWVAMLAGDWRRYGREVALGAVATGLVMVSVASMWHVLRAPAVPQAGIAAPAPAASPETPQRAPSQPPESARGVPATAIPASHGTELLVPPRGPHGNGSFRISNRSLADAVVTLAHERVPGAPLRMVYVAAGREITIGGIGTGSYVIIMDSGTGWRPSAGRFTRNQYHAGPLGPFQFWEVESDAGLESNRYDIVLEPH